MKNNFITKIIGATLAFAMMIGGAVGINAAKEAKEVDAAAVAGTFEKVTSSTLTAGDVVIFVNGAGTYALGDLSATSSGYGQTVAVSKDANGKIALTASTTVTQFVVETGASSGYAFKSQNNTNFNSQYMSYNSTATSKSNYLNRYATNTTSNTQAQFTLSYGTTMSVRSVYNTGRWLRFNSDRFACYYNANSESTTGTGVDIYKRLPTTFGDLDHIKITTPATKIEFDVGETFSSAGLVLTGYDGADEATANTQTYSSGYETDYDGHVFESGDIGSKTVTVTYGGKEVTYAISVSALPDFTHTYETNSVFESTTYSVTETNEYTPENGPEYITLGGYNYENGESMSLRNVVGMYFGNNDFYTLGDVKKNINKIVITTNKDVHNKVKMFEGPVALSEEDEVDPILSNSNMTLTYEFSGNNPFFKLKEISADYINMKSIKVYLGSTAVEVTITEVLADIKDGTYMTGSTLSESDFEVVVSWSNGNITEPASGFTWTVRGVANGTLAEGDNEVIITYQEVSSAPFNVVGTSIHATSVEIQEDNPIKVLVGGTIALHATVTPNNAMENVVWSSSNESIASVSDSGVVTAHAIGVAVITATAGSVSTTRQIIVSNPAKASYSLVKVGSTSAYNSSSDVTFQDGKIWNIPGNQTLNDGLKLGGNLKTALNRAMYSKSAYEIVNSVSVLHGSKDDVVTVNSVKLLVYSTSANAASGNEANADEIVEGTYVEDGTTTFVSSSGDSWENKYFRVVYNLSSTTTSNKGIILKQLSLDTPNPKNHLENAFSIKTISGVESNEGATVTNVALRFGGVIPASDWNTINSSWPITDFGVMFARGSMLTARSLDSLEKVFRNDPADVAMVHRGSVGTPNANGDNYVFTARLNLEEADYDEVFYAVPFIVAGGEYYFLQEMHYSVRTLAEECLTSGESSLSQAALTTLKGNN